jgi:hypothetical protein
MMDKMMSDKAISEINSKTSGENRRREKDCK